MFFQLAAGCGIFLIGVNLAFLLNLGNRLVPWFTFKIAAVTLLLIYVSLSLVYGNPATWRAVIGFIAMILDMVAVGWMWYSVTSMRSRGVVGLVPIFKSDEDAH
jgi:hypothetical protein